MNERLQSLYNTLKGDGYELPSFDVFTQDMADSTKANRMYNTLVTDGYELPTSFDVFYKDISPAQPQQTQPENTPSPDRPLGFSRLADPETYKEIGQGISDVVGTINKGATRFIPDILKTVGAVEETVGGKGYFTKAGEAVQEGIDYLNPVDPEFEQSFGGQVLSGAGQIIPLIATAGMSGGANALAQAPKVGGFLGGAKILGEKLISPQGIIAGAGMAAPEWEAAKAQGLSDEQALGVAAQNYFLGLSETFPIEKGLELVKILRATGISPINYVKAAGAGGISEFLQEGFQSYMTNQLAKDSYDPDRDPALGVLESASVGGVVGALIPFMGMAISNASNPEVKAKLQKKMVSMQAAQEINNESDTGDPALNQKIDQQTKEIINSVEQTTQTVGAPLPSNQDSNEAGNQAGLTTTPVDIPSINQETGEDITKKGEEFTFQDEAGEAKGTIVEDAASIQEIFAATDEDGNPKKGGKLYEKVITALQDKGINTVVVGAQSQGSQNTLNRLVEKGVLTVDPTGDVTVGDQTINTRFKISPKTVINENITEKGDTSQTSVSQEGEVKSAENTDPIQALELQSGMVTMDAMGKAQPTGVQLGENLKGAERKATVVEQIADAIRGKVETRGGVIDFQDSWNEKHPENPISNAEVNAAWNLIKKAPRDKGPVVTAHESDLLKDQIRIAYNAKEKGVRKGQQLVNEKIKVIRQAVKDNKLTARQANSLLTKLTNTSLFTPGSYSRLNTFIDKVIGDAQYAENLGKARSLQTRIRKFGRQKSGRVPVSYKIAARQFGKVDPSKTDVNEYLIKANEIISGFRSETAANYAAPNTESILSYSNKELQDQQTKEEEELDKEGDELNKEEGEADTTKSEKLRTIANNSIEHLKEKDLSKFTPEDQKTIESIKTIDTNQLTDDVLKQLIRTVDNIIENDNLINTGLIEVTSEIQKSLPLLDNIIAKEKPIIQEIGLWGELMNNPANILKRIYQKAKVEATVRMISINKYLAIGSNLEVEQDRAEASVDNKIKKIKKKYNTDVRDILQQSKLGLFGVLKQVRDIGEFSKVKRNVEVTIEGYSEAERAEESKAWETAWKPFEKVNTYEDLQKVLKSVEKQDTQVTELWQHFRDDLFTEKLQEESLKNAEKFHNTEFIPWDNYLPIVHTRVSDLVNTAEEIRTAGRGGGVVNSDISMKPKQASTSMKRNLSLSEGYVYSSTPIGDWLSKYAETIQDNALSKEQLRLSLLAKNKKFAALLGGNTNANMVIKAMKSMVATQRGLNNIVTKNSFERLMKVVSGSFRTIGTVRALGSVGQWIKQPVVLFKTAINLGTDVDLLAKGISATADIRKNGNKSPVKKLLNLTTLASRGLRLGKTDRGTASFYKFDKGAKRWFNEMLSEADVRLNKNSRVLLEKSIVTPDLFSAQSSFISYYLQSLREQGVKDVNLNTEFEKADQLERQLALAHAENMVEKTQTASNPAALSAIQGKTGSTGLDIMKNVYLPFSSFDADFKARFVSEVDGLIRNKDAHSAKELFGTLAEAGIYAAVSAVVIGAWREALRAAIRALSGSKAPEEDEEKDRKKKWKQFWGSYTQAVNPLALGSIGSDMSSSAINTLAYTLDTWEGPYISKKDWMKDNAIVYEPMDGPWYENMGVYSSGIAPIVEIGALAVDNPLGETIKVVDAYGNEKHIKISKEIAVLWSLKAMTEGLTLIGLTEADVANAVRAVYREQLKNGEKVNLHTPRGASNKKESNSLKLKKPKRLILKGGPHS